MQTGYNRPIQPQFSERGFYTCYIIGAEEKKKYGHSITLTLYFY